MLTSNVDLVQETDLDILESLPSDFNMDELERGPTEQEVREVVVSINPDSA